MRKDYSDVLENFTFPSKNKKRQERRKKDAKKAIRKQKISREVYDHDWYDSLHAYSKGKVHCSCPMCSGMTKTNSKKMKGKGGKPQKSGYPLEIGYGTTNHRKEKNWSISDLKKIEALEAE